MVRGGTRYLLMTQEHRVAHQHASVKRGVAAGRSAQRGTSAAATGGGGRSAPDPDQVRLLTFPGPRPVYVISTIDTSDSGRILMALGSRGCISSNFYMTKRAAPPTSWPRARAAKRWSSTHNWISSRTLILLKN